MVYASQVDRNKLTFQVSGQLWNRSLVMRDLETESLWSHILGECMKGELKGKKLELVPSVMTTWKKWLADNPETTVLDMKPTADRFDKHFYESPEEFVYAVIVAGRPRAYSFLYLQKNPIVQEQIAGVPVLVTFDEASTGTVVFSPGSLQFEDALEEGMLIESSSRTRFDPTSGSATAGPLKGTQLKKLGGIVSYRTAWEIFHPECKFAD